MMVKRTLYTREMKRSWKLLLFFVAILTLYISMIIGMYDPGLSKMLDEFSAAMPELMAAVGMKGGANSLIGFMSSYLYGFILLVFPLLYSSIRSHGLIARYVDRNSMVTLLAAPVRRRTVAMTQLAVLLSGMIILIGYSTVLELICAATWFPGELDRIKLLELNSGLFCLQLFIGSICFFCSCVFNDAKYSIGFGAGIPACMFVLRMLANSGRDLEKMKYTTFFSLFNPDGIIAGQVDAYIGMFVLLAGAVVLFVAAVIVFSRKDLHI